MRTPEFIQRCIDAGMPLDMALTAAKAFEAECEIALEQLLDTRRAKGRERQAKHRAKKAETSNAGNVMSRDITLDDVTTVSERDLTCEGAQVVILPSSLRSEDKPPVSPIGLTAPKGADKTRGKRLPDDWRPDEDGWAYALETLGPDVSVAKEFDRFRDYWRAVPGAKGRKLDWPATWRNWCRSAADRLPKPRKAHERPDPATAKFDAKQANYARAWEGADRAARSRWEP